MILSIKNLISGRAHPLSKSLAIAAFAMGFAQSAWANTFTVSNSGVTDYIINGQNDPALNLIRGETYTFNINASDHPFWIKSVQGNGTGNAYTNGVTGNGTSVGSITFIVPLSAPDTLFYNCQSHAAMTGTINITNPVPDIHYVNIAGSSPTPPYTNWVSAATNIQDAIDASLPGDTVLVSNGVYATGGKVGGSESVTSRVAIDKAITVESKNGPEVTIIDGGNNVRCVSIVDGGTLTGFTVRNGMADGTIEGAGAFGGGVQSEALGVVSNCILEGNVASFGAGMFGGSIYHSIIRGNGFQSIGSAGEGGSALCNIQLAQNCLIVENLFSSSVGNSAVARIVFGPTLPEQAYLVNCTLAKNKDTIAVRVDSDLGTGPPPMTVINCIVTDGGMQDVRATSSINNCLDGVLLNSGDVPGPPHFVDSTNGNFQLKGASPCIDKGENNPANTGIGDKDLLGADRINGGTVDIGVYETYNSDADSLSDPEEAELGTNPILADSDEDGLDDDEEVLTTLTDPLLGDTDDDGFLDGFEVDNGYSPTNNQHQALVDYISGNGGSFGLFEADTNGEFKVIIAIESSTNLPAFSPFAMTEEQTQINGEGALEFQFPGTNDVQFFRMKSESP